MKPIFSSQRESFNRNIYNAFLPVIAAPVISAEILKSTDICFTEPPQSVILHIDQGMNIIDGSGKAIADLYMFLDKNRNIYPIIYPCNELISAPDALVDFIEFNNIYDFTICLPFGRIDRMKAIYRELPYARCMIDARKEDFADDFQDIPYILSAAHCTAIILNPCKKTDGAEASESCEDVFNHEFTEYLQRRFICVYADENCSGGLKPEDILLSEINGVITKNTDVCYKILKSLPENTVLRPVKLYAHKGFQNNGKYSENTIDGVLAAAISDFDGAEIDIKYSGDNKLMVMHNRTTKGLFDSERELVLEEADFEEFCHLPRTRHPSEKTDLFSDLMQTMKPHTDTPVVIEFKPAKKYHKLERMVDEVKELLRSTGTLQNAVGIMGVLEPDLGYVHKNFPELPLCHCEGASESGPAPIDRREAEDRIYRIAYLTRGWGCGYNAEDTGLNRIFREYAKIRNITTVIWSRSWVLNPSKWEVNGPQNDANYLCGYDGWTTDHGEMFIGYPKRVEKDGTPVFRKNTNGNTGSEVREISVEISMKPDESDEVESKTLKIGAFYYPLHFGTGFWMISKK